MIEVSFALALGAGLLSFLSPCVLPLVPAYLSYISGVSVNELRHHDESGSVRRHAVIQALWFIAGFSLIFVILGASASLLGQWMLNNMALLGKVAGAVIVIFGLHYVGIVRIPFLMMDAHFDTGKVNAKHGIGALVLGSAFAFGWTPCVGPILGAILAVAGAHAEPLRGIALLAVYSLGLGIPFLLAALATDAFLRWSQNFKQYLSVIEKVSGVLLILVGAMIFLGSFSIVSSWLIDWFPFLADIEGTLVP
ncbi:MAG: cytochrome c biogenesis CcdA family protein [Mariprofundus sp.]